MSSSLESLPAELRNMIWEYACTSSTGILSFDSESRRFDVSQIGAGLLTTCRSLFEETWCLPLQLNRLLFQVPSPSVWFMVFLAKLNRLEEEMGWVLKMEVSFMDKKEE
ncbi:hypothetical protein GQ44DRAFT_271014 [Phaeosphaeriaceae sp. PMI808]|nr:hypothetical protein GQ44DRAFT_271014 [Phaeosphaeriaceae sp. PMI808]